MFALTFFGILHVPINVPALGLSVGEDDVDVDRELRAHGYSNALSGLCGSIQVGQASHLAARREPALIRTLIVKSELPRLLKQLTIHTKWGQQPRCRVYASHWYLRDPGHWPCDRWLHSDYGCGSPYIHARD